jgi:hypothetical protein
MRVTLDRATATLAQAEAPTRYRSNAGDAPWTGRFITSSRSFKRLARPQRPWRERPRDNNSCANGSCDHIHPQQLHPPRFRLKLRRAVCGRRGYSSGIGCAHRTADDRFLVIDGGKEHSTSGYPSSASAASNGRSQRTVRAWSEPTFSERVDGFLNPRTLLVAGFLLAGNPASRLVSCEPISPQLIHHSAYQVRNTADRAHRFQTKRADDKGPQNSAREYLSRSTEVFVEPSSERTVRAGTGPSYWGDYRARFFSRR